MSRDARNGARLPVAVDVVVFTLGPGGRSGRSSLLALLVRVRDGPFAGRWAFPGGRVAAREPLEGAARRELRSQTGLGGVFLEQLYTFGDPGRDPGGRVVSVAYLALVPAAPSLRRVARYAAAEWHPAGSLPPLAYDHDRVARVALGRLRAKLGYSNVAWSLLPRAFTMADLQAAYETILGRRLDRRNFRKKTLALGLLRSLRAVRRGAHRPAALFAFRSRRARLAGIA